MNYYGYEADYIHLKWGDMRKAYNFTAAFRAAHPVFTTEYVKYFMGKKSRFTDPLQIVNYVKMWEIPVHFYFNHSNKPAESLDEVYDYLVHERLPDEWYKREYGTLVGWDGEMEPEDVRVETGNQ